MNPIPNDSIIIGMDVMSIDIIQNDSWGVSCMTARLHMKVDDKG